MSETSARASRLAFALGSFARKGLIGGRAGVASERRLGRDAFDGPDRRHHAIVLAVHEACETPAELAEARFELLRALRLQVGNAAQAVRLHAPRGIVRQEAVLRVSLQRPR